MKLYLCANGFTQTQIDQAKACVKSLEELSHPCSMSEELSNTLYGDDSYVCFPPQDCDLIVSLGGDGALLKAAKVAFDCGTPLFGINAGRVGYLCGMRLDEIDSFDRKFRHAERNICTMLEVDFEGQTYYALNDIVISKTNFGKTADLSVFADEKQLFEVRADAVIVSTPTGSSAYNRSAGGPLVSEKVKALVVTPVCSNTLTPAYIVNDDAAITVKVNHEDAGVYADSRFLGTYPDELTVRKSDKTIVLYK